MCGGTAKRNKTRSILNMSNISLMGIQSGAHYQANHGVTRKDGKDPIQEELKDLRELERLMEEMANKPRVPYEHQPGERNKYEEMQRMRLFISRDKEGMS